MSRFGESLGVWELRVGGAELDLNPQMGDVRKFKRIVFNEQYKKDRALMFERFEDYMYSLIKRDYPESNEEELKGYLELNSNALFEEAMVRFRFTTREELNKSKQEAIKELKN